jgi:hypothetical protein
MSDAEETESKKSWFSHPMANMVVGFILTGVLGTTLTQHFMDRRAQEKARSEAVITRKEAVRELSHLIAARQLHAQLLVEAVESGASEEELKKIKHENHEAYKAWRTDRASTMLLAREVMSDEAYKEFSQRVEQGLGDHIFEPLRQCILDIAAKSKQRHAAMTAIEQCRIHEILDKLEVCSSALIDGLYILAAASTSGSDRSDTPRAKEARARIEKACP